MDVGMLWYDDAKRVELEEKVGRAMAYYQDKYGQVPNVCYVHPSLLAPDGAARLLASGVLVKPSKTVITDHFWMGVEVRK